MFDSVAVALACDGDFATWYPEGAKIFRLMSVTDAAELQKVYGGM